MLRTTIQTTDEAGKELPIPADLRAKVQRAADWLGTNLNTLADKFEIAANWQFAANEHLGLFVQLRLELGSDRDIRSHTFTLDRSVFADDRAIRGGLYGPLLWLGQEMAAQVEVDFAHIRRRLEADLQSLATAQEE